MAELLRGKPVADALGEDVRRRVEALAARGIVPQLAIVRIGAREDDLAYERNATKRCEGLGIAVRSIALPPRCSQQKAAAAIEAVNGDASIHGCLLLRPVPAHLDEGALCSLLDPAKDVDGITAGSLYGVFAGARQGFAPCTAEGCLRLLDHYGVSLEGARVTVVGRSLVIGRPVAALLLGRHATVTIAHSRTADLAAACRAADVIIAAVGVPRLIGAPHGAPGQCIVDVGMNWDEGSQGFVGDVDFEALEPLVASITPVPGGVGTLTTAVLAHHTVLAAERRAAC